MPRFIYTLFFLIFLLLGTATYIFFFVPPKNVFIILLFFGIIHLFSSILTSFIVFIFAKNKTNKIYRKIFIRLFLLFTPVVGFLALRTFKIATNVNVFLILLLASLLYILHEIKNRLPSRRIL